jgi:hypothetical protein
MNKADITGKLTLVPDDDLIGGMVAIYGHEIRLDCTGLAWQGGYPGRADFILRPAGRIACYNHRALSELVWFLAKGLAETPDIQTFSDWLMQQTGHPCHDDDSFHYAAKLVAMFEDGIDNALSMARSGRQVGV